jgi:outer membrane protein TolC
MSSRPRSSIAIVLSLACAILLGGCVNWSGDVARYKKILDGPAPASQPVAFDDDAPLSLGGALRLADADNEAIASRGEDYVQALAQKMRDAGTFLPTLTVAPSYTLSHGNATSIVGESGTTSGSTTSGGGNHQFSVPLDASVTGSLSNLSTLEAAGRSVEQEAQLLLDERQTILLQVVQSYYAVLKAEHQSAVYEHSVKLKSEKVRDQQARLKLGNVRPLDLAQSESDLAGTRTSLVQSQTDAANARSALARLIGVPAVRGQLSDEFEPPADVRALDGWQKRAEVQRQDLLAAARNREAARLSVDAAIREYYPTVSLNFEYLLYNNPGNAQSWSNVLSASIPIFSALTIEADVRKAWSLYRQAVLSESQARRQVTDDVNQNYQNLTGSRDQIADLRVEVEAAQRAYDLSERSYQLGSVSNLDRLTQQDNLLTAQLNLVSEQFNQKSYYLGLLRAAGELSPSL